MLVLLELLAVMRVEQQRPLIVTVPPPTPANAIRIFPTTAHATGERREVRNGTERDTKEARTINESTARCTPAPLDWAADVEETIGFTPPARVDRAHGPPVVDAAPARAPRDFSDLRSGTRNPWASLNNRRRRPSYPQPQRLTRQSFPSRNDNYLQS